MKSMIAALVGMVVGVLLALLIINCIQGKVVPAKANMMILMFAIGGGFFGFFVEGDSNKES